MARKLYQVRVNADGAPTAPRLLAEFTLDGGVVRAIYHSEATRMAIAQHGIVAGRTTLFPDSGRPFYDALMIAFSLSSTRFVRDEP